MRFSPQDIRQRCETAAAQHEQATGDYLPINALGIATAVLGAAAGFVAIAQNSLEITFLSGLMMYGGAKIASKTYDPSQITEQSSSENLDTQE